MSSKTKIIATVGPESGDVDTLKDLRGAGVDVFRLNFSHGSYEEHKKYIENINVVRRGRDTAIMQDLPGPKIRVGELEDGSVEMKVGETLTFSVDGSKDGIPVDYPDFANIVSKDDLIFLDDGTKRVRVQSVEKGQVVVKVEAGGTLVSHKGINIPKVELKQSAFTEEDRKHLEFGLEQGIDMVAVSFIESAEEVKKVKSFLRERDAEHVDVIAKIERELALENIDNILEVADGILVARGDMGVQMHFAKVPFIQKSLIKKCRNVAKPVITATHMLESMLTSPRPTRAEVTDITNAVINGTDAVMLSEETAVGDYPVESVKVMTNILEESESNLPPYLDDINKPQHVPSAIAFSAVEIANEVGAGSIFVLTESGSTARLISRYRPKQDVFALTPNENTLARLNLSWGINGIKVEEVKSIEEAKSTVGEVMKKRQIDADSHFVLCAGIPFNEPGTTNLVFVEEMHL